VLLGSEGAAPQSLTLGLSGQERYSSHVRGHNCRVLRRERCPNPTQLGARPRRNGVALPEARGCLASMPVARSRMRLAYCAGHTNRCVEPVRRRQVARAEHAQARTRREAALRGYGGLLCQVRARRGPRGPHAWLRARVPQARAVHNNFPHPDGCASRAPRSLAPAPARSQRAATDGRAA
jgi:ribosomal protein L44E